MDNNKGKKLTPDVLREKLAGILAKASSGNMRISTSEVSGYFEDYSLSADQMKVIYDFLLSRKVSVEGYVTSGGYISSGEQASGRTSAEEGTEGADANRTAELSPEEQRWLERYRQDLSSIAPEKEGEIEYLAGRLGHDDPAAKKRLTELLLPEVLSEALKAYRPGIHLSDMVQEGSLSLIMYLDRLGDDIREENPQSEKAAQDRKRIESGAMDAVRAGIEALAAEQTEVRTRDHKLVEKVEELKEGVTTLKEEYGRKVYLDEVADFMNITEEEAEDILRLAGEQIGDEDPGSGRT